MPKYLPSQLDRHTNPLQEDTKKFNIYSVYTIGFRGGNYREAVWLTISGRQYYESPYIASAQLN